MVGRGSTSSTRRRSRTPRASSLIAVVALVVGLAACKPMQHDLRTGKTKSSAEWRVAPIATSRGPGIDIRMRLCNSVHLRGDGIDISSELRPEARVVDARGTVVFDNNPYVAVQPAGSRVIAPGPDSDPQRIIVPIGSAKPPLRITASCTNVTSLAGGGFTWIFPTCTTATRSCPAQRAGSGHFLPPR